LGRSKLTEGDRREPMRFTFLPHALDDMEERNVTEERVRATVERPCSTPMASTWTSTPGDA
jgi:hypothetical protein